MVVNMIRWRPWSPPATKKYEARLVVKRLEGFKSDPSEDRFAVEVRWKGEKLALGSLRRTMKRQFTEEVKMEPNGVVLWEEEFHNICNLSSYKQSSFQFQPWEISFIVSNRKGGTKRKLHVNGTANLNLAEFVSSAVEDELELDLPLNSSGSPVEPNPSLCILLKLAELRSGGDIVAVESPPAEIAEKNEISAIKAGLLKVKILTEYVSLRRAKKACHEEESSRSSESRYCYDYIFYSGSSDDSDPDSDKNKEESSFRKSLSYETLACANFAGGSCYSSDEDLIYYTNRRSDVGCSNMNSTLSDSSISTRISKESKRSILKRKLGFRSPKLKGEPLLKKDYAEDGGDDIDFDRRQMISDDSHPSGWYANREDSVCEFGSDDFAIGSWEWKEIASRDGNLKLETEVFFASIDQRSEQAAGEGACTALVAFIADWFEANQHTMPVRSQFDSLIRDGSREWRNLCENESYKDQFPDKHFDLETVLHAKIRPLSVIPEKSFVGFFGMEELGFDFLQGAMLFDNIWDEITRASDDHRVYIVSWNDHFFVLKLEAEACYIIDTLGERLFEGCNQAFILRFDRKTKIRSDEAEMIYEGKDCCKEYIKKFLASIPIRELQADIKRGLLGSAPLHQRLQIEFQYTRLMPSEE